MRDQIRSYMDAGLGMLSPSAAMDLARSMLQGEGKERVSRAAQDLMDWSTRSAERLAEIAQREVRRQLKAMGVATREDLDALRKRVRDLERAAGSGAPSAKKSSAKKSTRKKSSARKSTAGKSTVKRVSSS